MAKILSGCEGGGGAEQWPSNADPGCPIRLINCDFGVLNRAESLDFTLVQYQSAVQLVTHEDTSLFAKLKAMFEIQVVLIGVLFSVASFLMAKKMTCVLPPLIIAISVGALFVAWGYGRSIEDGLGCLSAHKSKLLAIEAKIGLPPLLTLRPKRWILRHGPRVFVALSVVGLALGILMLALPVTMPLIEGLAAGQ